MNDTKKVSLRISASPFPPADVLSSLQHDLMNTRTHVALASLIGVTDGVATVNAEVYDLAPEEGRDVQSVIQSALDEAYGTSFAVAASGQSSSEPTEEQKQRDAEIERMLKDHPAFVKDIEEARVSGSPMHLVAAKIAAKELSKATKAAKSSAKPTPEKEPAASANPTEAVAPSVDVTDTAPTQTASATSSAPSEGEAPVQTDAPTADEPKQEVAA